MIINITKVNNVCNDIEILKFISDYKYCKFPKPELTSRNTRANSSQSSSTNGTRRFYRTGAKVWNKFNSGSRDFAFRGGVFEFYLLNFVALE